MTILFTEPSFVPVSGNSVVYPGAKLYFYETGTSTLQNTYTDSALSVAHANPVVADADGRFAPIYLDPTLLDYKIVLKDSSDVTIWTVDPYTATSIATTLASNVSNISALLAVDGTTTTKVFANGYHTAGDGGGGEFYWDASQDKASHDGGMIIDPTVTFPSDWTNQTQVAAWFTAGTGTGCWVRVSDVVTVKKFGAKGDGSTNDTLAINQSIVYAKGAGNPTGNTVHFPRGRYMVTEIDFTHSDSASAFRRGVKLVGAGRLATIISPFSAGTVLLNMLGTNNSQVEDMTFYAQALTSQAAIYMGRSTDSSNCNNNKFISVYTEGSYSVAAIVCNGNESTNFISCRFENTNSSADYCTFWTGGGSGVQAEQGITTTNGGTISESNNPNTDNRMFGTEFYAPFDSSIPVKIEISAGYMFYGCAIIGGSSDSQKQVSYNAKTATNFGGHISWYGCHFEVFGTGNVIHFLNADGSQEFGGINVINGNVVVSSNTSLIDFDRTNRSISPTLKSSLITNIYTPPGITNINSYVGNMNECTYDVKPTGSSSKLFVFGFAQRCVLKTIEYVPGQTRGVACYYEKVSSTIPPTSGTYNIGYRVMRETPTVGSSLGVVCTSSGTAGAAGTITMDTTAGSNVVTVGGADVANLSEGQILSVGGGIGTVIIRKLSGTTGYLSANVGSTVSGAAVSFVAPAFTAIDMSTYNGELGGTTANRPSSPVNYQMYYDTTLSKPIWYNGSNWVDDTGSTV